MLKRHAGLIMISASFFISTIRLHCYVCLFSYSFKIGSLQRLLAHVDNMKTFERNKINLKLYYFPLFVRSVQYIFL